MSVKSPFNHILLSISSEVDLDACEWTAVKRRHASMNIWNLFLIWQTQIHNIIAALAFRISPMSVMVQHSFLGKVAASGTDLIDPDSLFTTLDFFFSSVDLMAPIFF